VATSKGEGTAAAGMREGPRLPARRRTLAGGADRPGRAVANGGERSAGAVNKFGGEGAQTARVGEEELRPLSI
jgi:hypothetical protein